LTASEAWSVLTGSLERAIEQCSTGPYLRGMSSPDARERHLPTLLTMPGLGLFKPHDLNPYTGTALGLLTERHRPYSADEMEHFVLSCVQIGWTEPLTTDVAGWATQLWATSDPSDSDTPTYLYWDWHVKAIYSDYHVPRTKHGTRDRVVGARKQLMLHDAAGHLLFMRTYRGDAHLIDGMVDGTAYYEGLAESRRLTHQIFDREGLSVAHFKDLLGGEERRQFITCLKSNQYEGVDSFELSSSFAPFRHDRHGQVVQEIAEASYVLKDRRVGEDGLPLRAILLRKPPDEADDEADDEARLHVVVTSDWETPAADIARWYRDRYPKQENAIRDWWLPLGGDVNVGYDKREWALAEISQKMASCPMYELDDRKDQLLSALRLCLGNVLQWLRDTVFPESYTNATCKTLAPFVQMGGFAIEHPDRIEVFLDGFWQSAKQRDLEEVVTRCNAQSLTAPDGRPLRFGICPAPGHI
jgi:hypothetical protein